MTTAAGAWQYAYDDEDRLSSVSDPFGNTTTREYDADGNVTTVARNGQTIAAYTYADGRVTQRADAAGNVYQFSYNADGQLVGQTDPEGASFQYEYDANGRLYTTIDGNGNEIFREYGSDETSSSGACTSCGSTPLLGGAGGGYERLQKIIYPTFTKAFRYDDEGRVSEETYTFTGGETFSVTYAYDRFGRLQSTTGPDGRSTTYQYDLMGRRIRVDDPSGQTSFEYDRWDNLVALTDAKNQRTEFEYDSLGRLKKEIRPMGQHSTYAYDFMGRLWKMVDAKNQITEYGYDNQSRLATITSADGKTVTLSYDADGNLSGYSDGETSASYTYDVLGRKLSETVNYGTLSKSFSYSYTANGLKQTFTAPDGTVYTYSYGSNNELRAVQIPGLGAVTIADYQWNRPTTVLYPGGGTREYEHDGLMRLKQLTANDPGGNPLLDYSYEYDPAGNIERKTTEHGAYTYGYDAASRLTSANNPTLDNEAYTYDAVGNRLTASNATGTIEHNANNELRVYGDLHYDYDANGNLTEITLDTQRLVLYTYNTENRLVKVENGVGDVMAEYYYDPFGRRLWKDVGGERTYFFYSDEGLIAEYDASGNEIRGYGYQPDSTWTTDPLWLKQDGEYYFYQNDHLGTPQKLVKQNGAVVWSATYDAFGKAHVETETVVNNLRFPGQYYDAETGLHYNFQRYYDPGNGRYVSVDPIGFAGGNNWFEYAQNNPSRYRDITGLQTDNHKNLLWCCPDDPYTGCCGPDVTDAVNQTLENIQAIYESWGTFDSWMEPGEQNRSKQWTACTTILGMGNKSPSDLAIIPEWEFRIGGIFNPLGFSNRMSDRFTPLFAWDIKPLYNIGSADPLLEEGTLPTQVWPDLQDMIRNGVGVSESAGKNHDCRWTVTYAGGCFNAGYLNYLMWGFMNKMCYTTFRDHPKSFLWGLDVSLELAKYAKFARQNYTAQIEVLPIVRAGYSGGTPQSTLHSKCLVDARSGVVPPDIFPIERWNWIPFKECQ